MKTHGEEQDIPASRTRSARVGLVAARWHARHGRRPACARRARRPIHGGAQGGGAASGSRRGVAYARARRLAGLANPMGVRPRLVVELCARRQRAGSLGQHDPDRPAAPLGAGAPVVRDDGLGPQQHHAARAERQFDALHPRSAAGWRARRLAHRGALAGDGLQPDPWGGLRLGNGNCSPALRRAAARTPRGVPGVRLLKSGHCAGLSLPGVRSASRAWKPNPKWCQHGPTPRGLTAARMTLSRVGRGSSRTADTARADRCG